MMYTTPEMKEMNAFPQKQTANVSTHITNICVDVGVRDGSTGLGDTKSCLCYATDQIDVLFIIIKQKHWLNIEVLTNLIFLLLWKVQHRSGTGEYMSKNQAFSSNVTVLTLFLCCFGLLHKIVGIDGFPECLSLHWKWGLLKIWRKNYVIKYTLL